MEQLAEQVVSTEIFMNGRKYLMNISEGTLRFYEDTFKHRDFSEAG